MSDLRRLALGSALFFVAGVANGTLVDTGTTMIDTDTGLEWLDLTETHGMSWNAVEASSYVTADGYVHADVTAVEELFLNAGFLNLDNYNQPANDPAATALLNALGCTQFCGTINATGRGFAEIDPVQTIRPNYHTSGLGGGAALISLFSANKDLEDPTAGHYLVRVADTNDAPWLLQGYLSSFSAVQGSSIDLYVSSGLPFYDIAVYRAGISQLSPLWPTRLVASFDHVAGGEQAVPADAWSVGAQWTDPLTIAVPAEWPSGFYDVVLTTPLAVRRLTFVVREDDPGSTSDILLVDTAPTVVAYNGWGGKSLYPNRPPGSTRGWTLSLLRPGQNEIRAEEREFANWAEHMGIVVEYASAIDLNSDPTLLDSYGTFVTVGHSEYWSKVMRDAYDQFLQRGGNAAILSGNTMWWQVRFEGDTMICYKYDVLSDPVYGINNELITTNWSAPILNNPENSSIGVSFRNGGYVNALGFLPASEGYGGYTITRDGHPLMAGTELVNGDVLGQRRTIVGYEVDGALFDWVDGFPVVTGDDGTPTNFRILAYSPAETEIWTGNGTMGVFEVNNENDPANNGKVFNAATVDWADGLWSLYDDTIWEPQASKIMLNVLADFSPSSGASCSVDEPIKHDADGDGVDDTCDNCVLTQNAGQFDANGDGTGNACQENACH